MRLALLSLVMVSTLGCTGPMFTNVGVGRNYGVRENYVQKYAERHNITYEQAIEEVRDKTEQAAIAEHAEKYGISAEEARKQLGYAAANEE
ncbi:hypothetical protein [Aeoliella mucimassa]|uniref:Uncharacterized protein n=1 Tax=Aeoliella mucimassa TaxID=2527972 RepID=A0A518AHU3_9BACT|nr:hypothetical protein [Aeoliella mucimassa]QDU54275.1 hypothetical protein Pan181_04560 [Aeoliella mucimassa]